MSSEATNIETSQSTQYLPSISSPFSGNLPLIKWSFLSTTVWMLVAHLYRWVHMTSASHDSLLLDQMNDAMWEISLGRFLQPVYCFLRGDIPSPFLIGILSIVFLSLTVIVTCKLLNLTSPFAIVLLSGILSTNISLILHNATYVFSVDLSMLACLLGALSVFWCARYKYGFILGIPCIVIIFALSPGYIAYPITLTLIFLIRETLIGCPLRTVVVIGCKFLAFLFIGAILYLLIFPAVQGIAGVTSISYRGFSEILGYEGNAILPTLIKTYTLPFDYFIHPKTYGAIVVSLANAILTVLAVAGFVLYCRKAKVAIQRLVLVVIFLLLVPLAMDCVFFIAKGAVHELMFFSFNLYYALCLVILYLNYPKTSLQISEATTLARIKSGVFVATTICFSAILLSNIIFANQVYVKKDLEAQATQSVMTRIVDEIEGLDGYTPGETPVAIIGSLRFNEYYSRPLPGYNHLEGIGLGFGGHSVTRLTTYRWYLTYVLNVPINLIADETVAELASEESVQEMPIFPHNGYCEMVDGTVIVKLSPSPDLK